MFVKSTGCSVPDYIFCPVDNLKECVEMKVLQVSDIIEKFDLHPPLSIPDHSLLKATFKTSHNEGYLMGQSQNITKDR